MPAKKRDPEENKGTVGALVQRKKINKLTYLECRRIAEDAINLAYDEAMKNQK